MRILANAYRIYILIFYDLQRFADDKSCKLEGTFRLTIAYCLVDRLERGSAMYCNYCGKVIQDDAAVCAYCGVRVGASVARKRLVRPRQGRKIAGVCLGFAEYFDVDVTVVRLVWLIASFMTGIGLISYPIAWIIMPEEPLLLTAAVGVQRVTNP
jgi:phage shock protein C